MVSTFSRSAFSVIYPTLTLVAAGTAVLGFAGCSSASTSATGSNPSDAAAPVSQAAAAPMAAGSKPGSSPQTGPFRWVSHFSVPGQSAEILAATPDGGTLFYTDAPGRQVGMLDIKDIAAPKLLSQVSVSGEPTSVEVTRDGKFALVSVQQAGPGTAHHLLVISVAERKVAFKLALPGQPDCLKVSGDGRYAAIVIENQRSGEDKKLPQAPAGSLAILDLVGTPAQWRFRHVKLTGLAGRFPTDPEPEFVAINADNVAAVTLQENNAVVLVDLKTGQVKNSWTCGASEQLADLSSDDAVKFQDKMRGLREPDGIAWTPGGLLLTANEGDYDAEIPRGFFSGGRGATLFGTDGKVVWNSGNAIEQAAHAAGAYRDKRSSKKGVEPEGAAVASFPSTSGAGSVYGFIGCERADGVAVFDLKVEKAPVLLQWLATGERPEGILALPARGLLFTANEGDGTISIFRHEKLP